MLHVTPPGLSFITGSLGVGIGKNSLTDLYAGGTLRVFDPLVIIAGWVWQRTPQLTAGLNSGEVVASPNPALLDDLDLAYRGSFYVGIGIIP